MERAVTKELEKAIKMLDKKFSDDEMVKQFEQSTTEFEILVKKGLIKKRGNNIMSILDRSSTNITFNTL